MENWISQTTVLKLIAVFFVLIVVFRRSKIGKTQWILSIVVLAVTSVLHYFKSDYHGILFLISGAVAAFIFTFPLYKLRHINNADLIASCTVGGIIGPAGYSTAFLIAFMLFALQHLLKANYSLMSGRFTYFTSFYGPDLANRDDTSVPEESTTGPILYRGRRKVPLIGYSGQNKNKDQEDPDVQQIDNILPWRGKLALATVTSLMIGIPL